MGIQANVKRQEAKLAAQAIQAEQPQAVLPEPMMHPGVEAEALRHVIRAELKANRPESLDMNALREAIRAELHAALSVPVPVDIRMCRSAIHEELRDIHLALRLLTEAIQAQVQTGYDDDEEESDEQDDELLPTALSYATSDQDSGEPKMFPAQENEEEDRVAPGCIEPEQFVVQSPVRPESPIRRLQRPGPEIIVLKSPPRALRRWEPLA